MGYYLPRRSYLKPVTQQRLSQKFISAAAICITFFVAAIIISAVEFVDYRPAFADKESANLLLSEKDFTNLPSNETSVPVQISYCKLEKSSSTIHIKWSTLSEKENDYFSVEKSVNGKEFVELGKIKGAGTTNRICDYSFSDESKDAEDLIFYRIRQTSKNGLSSFIALENLGGNTNDGKPLYVINTGIKKFTDSFILSYYTVQKGSVCIDILNENGTSVFRSYDDAETGINSCRFINGADLLPGDYKLRISTAMGVSFQKISKI